MKTKEEIKDEIAELYGAYMALSEAMEHLHSKRMESAKKMSALKHMLIEMEEGDENG